MTPVPEGPALAGIPHGNGGYTRGCKCSTCVQAHRDYGRAYMARRRALMTAEELQTARARNAARMRAHRRKARGSP
jgi:hypothetical protein